MKTASHLSRNKSASQLTDYFGKQSFLQGKQTWLLLWK